MIKGFLAIFILLISCVFITDCGVNGKPVPPDVTPLLGNGSPKYKKVEPKPLSPAEMDKDDTNEE